ncbi:MAG: alpha/beta fold hydrolase [Smithellaceae bacterium]
MIKKFSIDKREIACWINPGGLKEHPQSLVFIHGSGNDHTCWSYQYSRMHKRFNVVAIDLPGHGASTGEGENDIDQYCLWIKKLLDVLQLKNPVLIGHSLGAAIVMKCALRYPQDIAAIVPVGGGIKMPVNPDLLNGLKTQAPLIIDLICKFAVARENRPKLFEPLKKSMSKANMDVMYGDTFACSKFDLTSDIGKIKVPALVMCGTEDKMTPADFSRQIVAVVDGARLCLIEGAGHMVMLEKPAEFNTALSQFALAIS